jgi:hypothetical protein
MREEEWWPSPEPAVGVFTTARTVGLGELSAIGESSVC